MITIYAFSSLFLLFSTVVLGKFLLQQIDVIKIPNPRIIAIRLIVDPMLYGIKHNAQTMIEEIINIPNVPILFLIFNFLQIYPFNPIVNIALLIASIIKYMLSNSKEIEFVIGINSKTKLTKGVSINPNIPDKTIHKALFLVDISDFLN